MLTTDVVLIGTGPVGLFSIFECGMLGLRCHAFDPLPQVGGQCSALYPEKPIYDIPAYPKILAQDLITRLEEQAAPFHPSYHLAEKVVRIEKKNAEGKLWQVEGSKGTLIEAKVIIIAAGGGAFGPNRPPLPGIEQFEPHSVHYSVRSKESYRGKHLVIAGGGDSAVDWAIELCQIAASVSVVHRRSRFRAAPGSEEKLKRLAQDGHIQLVFPYQLSGLEGKNNVLEAVRVQSLEEEKKVLKADILLPFFGLSMDLGPVAAWGLSMDKNIISVDPATCQTSEDGVYAIGDIATYAHKQKLILCGFAEAAYAAHAIRSFLHPGEVFHFEYSTTHGVPKF